MNEDFHNISIDFGKFVYIYLRKFLLVTKRVRGRFVAFSMSGYFEGVFMVFPGTFKEISG